MVLVCEIAAIVVLHAYKMGGVAQKPGDINGLAKTTTTIAQTVKYPLLVSLK
jgi:hypothetical protein